MRIGYPCINRSVGCTANSTFRLRNLSDERLVETLSYNLTCLRKILEFNCGESLLFFRISSDLVPFASHSECTLEWRELFSEEFRAIGAYACDHAMRISMHPDQFVLLNAKDKAIREASIRELRYHADVLDSMGLPVSAKIQIHVGGVYAEKKASMQRFVEVYRDLDPLIRRRLVVENDDGRYTAADCLEIHGQCGIPILFDSFHHQVNNYGEPLVDTLAVCIETWKKHDGIAMTDYSSQHPGGRPGAHVTSIDIRHFKQYLKQTSDFDFDIMLEIKDKEPSAQKAREVLRSDPRFRG